MNILEQAKDEKFIKEQFVKGRILDDTKDYGRTQFVDEIYTLLQENEQLKMINKEYEGLNKEKFRGFKIINVQEYDMYELLSYKNYKDNWNKLKNYIKIIYKGCPPHEKEVLMFITDKMEELEQGSGGNE